MALIREVVINDRKIKFEFEKYAKQANGSVMVSSGGTQVLVTVCASEQASAGLGFFPLGVDYIEKFYASGRIPGGFNKREGKPSDAQALKARVIDRPLRPCFPKNYQNETVVTALVMSYEQGYSPAPLALVGASTALMISDIPFDGPVASLTIGLKDGKYIIDPFEGDELGSDLDLNIACKKDAVVMVEAGANFLTEEQMVDAIDYAHKTMQPLIEMQEEIREKIGKKKWILPQKETDVELCSSVEEYIKSPIAEASKISEKIARSRAFSQIGKDALEKFNPEESPRLSGLIKEIVSDYKSKYIRSLILDHDRRLDGRNSKQIRPITCEINNLTVPHGSALFTRGETQALASVTLASGDDGQRSESLWDNDLKERFMLHYNFPPFSVGEARMMRPPGRREIGHGTLARRALQRVVPDVSEFNYCIRVVSETLESNGSSSMATVCAASMAMLSAGVPLKKSIAGIAMGLIKEGDKSVVLSDILGDEDHLGDMDFKVCGDADGISALQMDIKIAGLSLELVKTALLQAKEGRKHILSKLTDTISEPIKVSSTAPRMINVKVKSLVPTLVFGLVG